MTAATRTPTQRGSANRRKGHTAERDVAKYLRAVGYPDAERAVVTGGSITAVDGSVTRLRADPGDVAGVPFIVSVKDCAAEQVDKWMVELDAMQHLTGAADPPRLLVHKRRGKADPSRWWCWMTLAQVAYLAGGRSVSEAPVRLEFAAALVLLTERVPS